MVIFASEYWQRRTLPETSSIEQLIEERRSGEWVSVTGRVHRTLGVDDHGDPHQRFILRLSRDHSVLVAHNLAIAERVPAAAGDELAVRGRFEWNEQGGVIHWTHRDPKDARAGGWIRVGDRVYR